MKKMGSGIMALALSTALLIVCTGCSKGLPHPTQNTTTTTTETFRTERPQEENDCDFSYSLQDGGFLDDFFGERPAEAWEEQGRYTLLLKGLSVPVTVTMEGRTVVSLTAYGHTETVNIEDFQDGVPVSVAEADGVIAVNENLDYDGRTWLFTPDAVHRFVPEGAISTQVFAQPDGTLRYTRYWGEYYTSFNQWDTAPLDLCCSRDHFLYEKGRACLIDGRVTLIPEKTVVVSDEYDLDTLFATAKQAGMYEEYATVDALLASHSTAE